VRIVFQEYIPQAPVVICSKFVANAALWQLAAAEM
jgi:hypothetical protein